LQYSPAMADSPAVFAVPIARFSASQYARYCRTGTTQYCHYRTYWWGIGYNAIKHQIA
jgi:hypothetical protein